MIVNKLGQLIEVWERTEEHGGRIVLAGNPESPVAIVEVDGEPPWVAARLAPWLDRFQEVADRDCDGIKLGAQALRKMRGRILQAHPEMAMAHVNDLTLPTAYELLTPKVPKTRPAAVDASEDKTPEALVVLNGPDEDVIVWGKTKAALPPAQYRVIEVLVKAKANGERLSAEKIRRRHQRRERERCRRPIGRTKTAHQSRQRLEESHLDGKGCRTRL